MRRGHRIPDELAAQGTELLEFADARRQALMRRADEIREQFEENVSSELVTNFTGWTLVSAGISWGVTDWMRGRRSLTSMWLPVALITLGAAVLSGNRAWQSRAMHIGEAEERVREELQSLDPFARMRVVKDVATETIPLVRNVSFRRN